MDTQSRWIDILTDIGALWIHDGNPRRPHALLTSGKHSNGFFNCSVLLRHPDILAEACLDLLNRRNSVGRPYTLDSIHEHDVKMVVGSALGAITIAHEVARILGLQTGFTEKVDDRMVLKRFPLEPGTTVLVVEDVMTTGGTTLKTIAGIEKSGGLVFDTIPVLVNRSGRRELEGCKIVALIDEEMPIWTPEECPLCAQGSEALRPKGNWDQLTADYGGE